MLAAKSVLLFAPFGSWSVHHQFDEILAAQLKACGAKPVIIYCDGVLQTCGTCDVLQHCKSNHLEVCRACAESGKAGIGQDVEHHPLSSFLNTQDYAHAGEQTRRMETTHDVPLLFEGVDIAQAVKSSLHTRLASLNEQSEAFISLHRQYRYMGILVATALSRIMDAYNPVCTVIFNGRFAPYKIAASLAKARGIRYVMHERGLADDSFIVFDNEPVVSMSPFKNKCVKLMEFPLPVARCEDARRYLMDRESGRNMNWPSYNSQSMDDRFVRTHLVIPENARIVGIFTSSPLEMATVDDPDTESKQFEWLEQILQMVAGRPEYFVVRHHPNITGTRPASPDWGTVTRIRAMAQSAALNVRIISSDEKFDVYALIKNLDGAIVFNSSVAYEAAGRAVPVLAFTSWIDVLAPFVLRSLDADSFLRTLDALLEQRSMSEGVAQLQRPYRFIDALLNGINTKFRSFGLQNRYFPEHRFNKQTGLTHDDDPALQSITDAIINEQPLELPRLAMGDAAEEQSWLEEEYLRLEWQKRQIRRDSKKFRKLYYEPAVAIISSDVEAAKVSFRRQRWPKCNFYSWEGGSSQTLADRLADLEENYVYVDQGNAMLDEAFLSSLAHSLVSDPDALKLGAMHGAFLINSAGHVMGETLTLRTKTSWDDQLVSISGKEMLGMILFRRKALIDLLNHAAVASINQLHAPLARMIVSEHISQLAWPMQYFRRST